MFTIGMGGKVLVVKALPLIPIIAGAASVGAGALRLLGRKGAKEGLEAAGKGAAKTATQRVAQAATEGAKQMSGKQFAMQMAQQQQNNAAQRRQEQKYQQEQRALEMAEKAKGGAGTMQKQLRGILDDLRLLKGTLQLPTALSEELRDSIKTLDRNHEIVNGKDETLVHNTTPFTEDIIRRLAETEDEKTEEPLFQPQQLFY